MSRPEVLFKYKDLPIPQLTKENARYWFKIYDFVMETTDPYIKKSCLFWYLSPEIENDRDWFEKFANGDYTSIRSYFSS